MHLQCGYSKDGNKDWCKKCISTWRCTTCNATVGSGAKPTTAVCAKCLSKSDSKVQLQKKVGGNKIRVYVSSEMLSIVADVLKHVEALDPEGLVTEAAYYEIARYVDSDEMKVARTYLRRVLMRLFSGWPLYVFLHYSRLRNICWHRLI